MDKDILNEVIEAEKEIHQCIEGEQARLRAWLEQVRREAEERVKGEAASCGRSLDRAMEAATQEAAARAKQVVRDAEARAARLASLTEGALTGIIMRQVLRILPE